MKGILKDISRSLEGKFRITFETETIEELKDMKGYDLEITVKTYRHKRSLNANAYFHVLCGKLADALRVSKPKMKNILLGRYGQRELMDDKPVIMSVISAADDIMWEHEDIHCIPVGHATLQGKDFTHWALIRPSHTYDTREMAILIDGTIEEAKEQGIETMTSLKIERMKRAWKARYYSDM